MQAPRPSAAQRAAARGDEESPPSPRKAPPPPRRPVTPDPLPKHARLPSSAPVSSPPQRMTGAPQSKAQAQTMPVSRSSDLNAVEVRARRLLAEFERVAKQTRTKPKFMIPAARRKCRDVICLITLLVAWVCLVVIGFIAFATGQPDVLIHGIDYQGQVCGRCPASTTCGKPFEVVNPALVDAVVVCVDACPAAGTRICDYNGTRCFNTFTNYKALLFRCVPTVSVQSNCTSSPYATSHGLPLPAQSQDPLCGTCLDPVLGSDGLPMDPSSSKCVAKRLAFSSLDVMEQVHPSVAQSAGLYSEYFARLVSDLSISYRAVAVGGGPVALVAAMIWVALLGVFGRLTIWTSLVGVVLGSGFLAFELLVSGGVITQSDVAQLDAAVTTTLSVQLGQVNVFALSNGVEAQAYAIAGWVMVAVSLILLLLLLMLWTHAGSAVSTISASSQALWANSGLLLLPISSVFVLLGISAWWAMATVYLVSAGQVSLKQAGMALAPNDGQTAILSNYNLLPSLLVLHTFGSLWTALFYRAILSTTTAGVIASWHWSERGGRRLKDALFITLRFHLGSLALGSFIVALLQIIRWMLNYVTMRVKVLAMTPGSRVALAIAVCLGYLIECLNVVFKFATRLAYVVIAIRGSSFCRATKTGFTLVSAQPAGVLFTVSLAWLVLLVGRIAVAGLAGYVTYLLVIPPAQPELPVVCSVILSWLVGGTFLDLYSDAVDALMIAKCEDALLASERRTDGPEFELSDSVLREEASAASARVSPDWRRRKDELALA